MQNISVEEFFNTTPEPENAAQVKEQLNQFVNLKGKDFVLVTSGGTTIPLERNTVRYIDNFSSGGRGAASAEYFLEKGYRVIYLHRKTALKPYERHLTAGSPNVLDFFSFENDILNISETYLEKIKTLKQKQESNSKQNLILFINFTSLFEYLQLLKICCESLNFLENKAIIYCAAAVSDYFIPFDKMDEHKIQSSSDSLNLNLDPVPKMITPLRNQWCPNAFIITFKLETDENILESKIIGALEKYKHNLVIGNLLSSYKNEVHFYQNGKDKFLVQRNEEQKNKNEDIEKEMINQIYELHQNFQQ